jgi:hypothetical protein
MGRGGSRLCSHLRWVAFSLVNPGAPLLILKFSMSPYTATRLDRHSTETVDCQALGCAQAATGIRSFVASVPKAPAAFVVYADSQVECANRGR